LLHQRNKKKWEARHWRKNRFTGVDNFSFLTMFYLASPEEQGKKGGQTLDINWT